MSKHMFVCRNRAHLLDVSPARRRHRREVARWALAKGIPAERDSLAALVATRGVNEDGSISALWTIRAIEQALNRDIYQWCTWNGVTSPYRLGETLRAYLLYLGENGLLEAGSDSLRRLLTAATELSSSERNCVGSHVTQAELGPGTIEASVAHHPSAWSQSGTEAKVVHLMPKKSSMASSPS